MAHYEGVKEQDLLSAITNAQRGIDRQMAQSLVNEAKALPIDGAGASDNMINAAQKIADDTNLIYSKLQAAYDIALDIAKYKSTKKKLDKTKEKLTTVKEKKNHHYNSYHNNVDKQSPSAQGHRNKYLYYKNEANKLSDDIDALKKELNEIGRRLSAKGYPPV